ncbi:MAG: HAD family hydrolase [Roseiflexaceae bacterium]
MNQLAHLAQSAPLTLLAFDADDTLWHNERLYAETQAAFQELLAYYHSPAWIEERLFQTEMRNLQHFGYGIKAFALSMIETAVELTEGRIGGQDIQQIITMAKRMIAAEVELLDHVAATIPQLAAIYPLMLITKGDLRDQEDKIARSGLASYFQHIEVVSDKNPRTYAALFEHYQIAADQVLMVGNSVRSDILPVLDLGGWGVYIPYHVTWAHEHAELPSTHPRFYQLEHMGLLPDLLAKITAAR